MLSFITILWVFFLILYTISIVYFNEKVFRILNQEDKKLHRTHTDSTLYRNLLKKYIDAKETSRSNIDIHTFIESYFVNYQATDGKKQRNVMGVNRYVNAGSNLLILGGVLGTFIGLIISLFSINIADTESFSNVIQGMYVAFITSIFGIIFSIACKFYLNGRNIEHTLVTIMLKLENLLRMEDKESMDHQMITAMNGVRSSIDRMALSFIDMKDATEGWNDASGHLIQFNKEFSGTAQQLREIFSNLENTSLSFNEKLNVLSNHMAGLNETTQSNSQALDAVQDSLQMFHTDLDSKARDDMEQRDRLFIYLKDISNSHEAYMDQLQSNEKEQNERHDAVLKAHHQQLETLEELSTGNEKLVQEVAMALEAIEDTLASGSFESLKESTDLFSDTLKGMDAQFEQLLHYFQKSDSEKENYNVLIGKLLKTLSTWEENYKKQQEIVLESIKEITKDQSQMTAEVGALMKNATEVFEELEEKETHIEEFTEKVVKAIMKNSGAFLHAEQQLAKHMESFIEKIHEKQDDMVDTLQNELGRISVITTEYVEANRETQKAYENIGHLITESSASIHQIASSFDVYNETLTAKQQQFITELANVIHQLEKQGINKDQATEQLVEFAKSLNDTLKGNQAQFEQQLQILQNSLQSFTDASSQDLKTMIEVLNKDLGSNIRELGSEITQNLRTFDRYVDTTNTVIKKQFEEMTKTFNANVSHNRIVIDELRKSIPAAAAK